MCSSSWTRLCSHPLWTSKKSPNFIWSPRSLLHMMALESPSSSSPCLSWRGLTLPLMCLSPRKELGSSSLYENLTAVCIKQMSGSGTGSVCAQSTALSSMPHTICTTVRQHQRHLWKPEAGDLGGWITQCGRYCIQNLLLVTIVMSNSLQ